MPMTISAILAVSSSPSTMNRMGSTASGGIIETVDSSGDSSARTRGIDADGQRQHQRRSTR